MCACGYMNDEYIVPMCPHTKKHLPPPMGTSHIIYLIIVFLHL